MICECPVRYLLSGKLGIQFMFHYTLREVLLIRQLLPHQRTDVRLIGTWNCLWISLSVHVLLGYVSTCAERLRDGLGTATADGCRPRLYVSTTADSPRERRGSAVTRLQQKIEFYPFSFKWFKPCLNLSTITEQYKWNECLTYKIYV